MSLAPPPHSEGRWHKVLDKDCLFAFCSSIFQFKSKCMLKLKDQSNSSCLLLPFEENKLPSLLRSYKGRWLRKKQQEIQYQM